MPTVTSHNKAEFDREFLRKKGLLKDKEKDDDEGLEKGKEYELHGSEGKKYKYLGSTAVDGGKKRQHRFKGEGPNSYRSFMAEELAKHVKR